LNHRGVFLLASTMLVGANAGCDGCSKPTTAPADAAPVSTLIADAAPVNVTTLPAASVAHVVNPMKLPAYNGPTGSVEGTIKVDGARAPSLGLSPATFTQCPAAEKFYNHAFREGDSTSATEPEGPRWLGDAIVVIKGYAGFFVPAKDEATTVAIEGCTFKTRTITMTYGQRLDVKNLTKEYWAPELEPAPSLSGALMMATPGGDAVKIYPKQAGRYHVRDHDRKYAVADLFVLQYPLHGVSDGSGHFRIDGIPVGKRDITVTHPYIADVAATKELDIREGVVTQIDLMLHSKPAPSNADAGKSDAQAPYPGLH